MLILISDAFDNVLPKRLQAFGEVTDDTRRLAEADVVLVRSKTKCTKQYIDAAKNLKLIIRGGVGIDNIDSAYAQSKGVLVRNTPKASAIAVAELAFALMLSVPTHLIEAHESMKRGEWCKSIKRTELYGKTLALLGIGNIATQVATRASAFGMRVVAYDKYVSFSPVATLVSTAVEAVRDANYISLHIPLSDETRNFFDEQLIHACTRSPVVVNTSRALCVDADAMAAALRDGRIAWYATDVYPTDPPDPAYPLLGCDNVTLTPHIGANSEENLVRIGEEVCAILDELIKGGKL